ncbi:MAG: hypothetical protein ACI9TB_002245, partial [Parasphingorhabdus sp.]
CSVPKWPNPPPAPAALAAFTLFSTVFHGIIGHPPAIRLALRHFIVNEAMDYP